MPEKKTYRPKSGKEGMALSENLADREKPFVVEPGQWPYSTDDLAEQGALDAHPWVADAESAGSDSDGKPLSRMNKAELVAEAERRGVQVDPESTNDEIKKTIEEASE